MRVKGLENSLKNDVRRGKGVQCESGYLDCWLPWLSHCNGSHELVSWIFGQSRNPRHFYQSIGIGKNKGRSRKISVVGHVMDTHNFGSGTFFVPAPLHSVSAGRCLFRSTLHIPQAFPCFYIDCKIKHRRISNLVDHRPARRKSTRIRSGFGVDV